MIKKHFECKCYSPEHRLTFFYNIDDGLMASIFLNEYRRWYQRIWVAIKFVFGYKCRYGHWDTFMMKEEDYDGFIQLIEIAKGKKMKRKRMTFTEQVDKRRKDADERQEYRNTLTDEQQLEMLDKRPGKSTKEKNRLNKKK